MKFKNMTIKEAKEYFGKELYDKMIKTELLLGITCRLNDKKELVVYACDWENAYHKVKTGRELFFD